MKSEIILLMSIMVSLSSLFIDNFYGIILLIAGFGLCISAIILLNLERKLEVVKGELNELKFKLQITLLQNILIELKKLNSNKSHKK